MNSVLLKSNVNAEQAEEIMDFLYYNDEFNNVEKEKDYIKWFHNNTMVAKWTNEYRNLMVDESIIKH